MRAYLGFGISLRPLFALALPLLFLLPHAAATQSYDHYYVMGGGTGCAGGGILIRNCETYFPNAGETKVKADVMDSSGQTVRIRICHEWTYDDGSHARVVCHEGCSPSFSDPLSFPPWPWNTTYRVIVDLRNGPAACQTAATAGHMHVAFT